jgi:hypothetical protein
MADSSHETSAANTESISYSEWKTHFKVLAAGKKAVDGAGLFEALDSMEQAGPREIGATALSYDAFLTDMKNGYATVRELSMAEKIKPPLDDEDATYLVTKLLTYENLAPADESSEVEKPEEPTEPERTSDRKA